MNNLSSEEKMSEESSDDEENFGIEELSEAEEVPSDMDAQCSSQVQ